MRNFSSDQSELVKATGPSSGDGVLRRTLTRFAAASCGIVLALALLLAGICFQERMHELVLLRQQTQRILDLKVDILSREFRWVQSDLLYLAGQDLLRGLAMDADRPLAALQEEFVRLAEHKRAYDQIRFLNAEGKEVVRVNYADGKATVVPEDELQTKANRYYYQEALALPSNAVFVSPLDLNVEHGQIERPYKPVIRFIAPVDGKQGERLGLVAINYLGGRLLERLSEVPAGVRGSVLVVNGAGEYIQGPSSSDAWGWLLGHSRSFRDDFAAPWRLFHHGGDAQVTERQGLFTFRRFSPDRQPAVRTSASSSLPDMDDGTDPASPALRDLILVSHVPRSAMYATSNALFRKLLLFSGPVVIAVLGLAWHWAHAGAVRATQQERLAASEARLRVLSKELLTSQEVERRRISRELHDNLKQQVTALRLYLRMGAGQIAGPLPLPLRHAGEAVDRLLADLQELATRLRTSLLDDLGLEEALEEYLRRLDSSSATEYTWTMELLGELSPLVNENLFRIVQEATTNIEKHASAARASIDLRVIQDAVHLEVSDNGLGFDLGGTDGSRLGILGMRERAELLGGSCEIQSFPHRGTAIRVTLPTDAEE